MKRFYENSYHLWVIGRVITILIYTIYLFKTFEMFDTLSPGMIMLFFIPLHYMVCMYILAYHELRKSELPFLVRSFTGGLSLLIALGWMYLSFMGIMIFEFAGEGLLSFLIAVWFIVFAFFDIMNIKNEYN